MKFIQTIQQKTGFALLAGACSLMLLGSCNKELTKQDVQENIEEAREATQEAEEETKEALASREQYYEDFRAQKVKELEDRSEKIDDRVKELKKISDKEGNTRASDDIKSAIDELQREKEDINQKIEEAKSIQETDWTSSYDELDKSIAQIEGEIDKLEQSLEN
ncbi:hypothetical protein SAMN05421823_102244 [Catalinimonas alkaloidigena]|uniref:Uncharacterized protein n=1 Tax=Catalinimonas alkaloidigena TaxID=1075417 RepID=A0A1G9AC54_9BACT|nr:hypothetical protein [Catalinimonas alkaloidigena]SDK24821.1 hypothetical protein SAMN05421823_102244 [Catalinimonas alkaloidigena]